MAKRILLIDDSRTQLESFKLLLKRAGYEVITAADGLEGIQKTYQTRPDLIISDIQWMKNIETLSVYYGGIELIQESIPITQITYK